MESSADPDPGELLLGPDVWIMGDVRIMGYVWIMVMCGSWVM